MLPLRSSLLFWTPQLLFVSAGAAVVLVDALLPHALRTMDAHITADTAAIALFFTKFFPPINKIHFTVSV